MPKRYRLALMAPRPGLPADYGRWVEDAVDTDAMGIARTADISARARYQGTRIRRHDELPNDKMGQHAKMAISSRRCAPPTIHNGVIENDASGVAGSIDLALLHAIARCQHVRLGRSLAIAISLPAH